MFSCGSGGIPLMFSGLKRWNSYRKNSQGLGYVISWWVLKGGPPWLKSGVSFVRVNKQLNASCSCSKECACGKSLKPSDTISGWDIRPPAELAWWLSFSLALGANRCFDYFFFSWICLQGVPIAQSCWIKGFISLSLLYGPAEVSSSLRNQRDLGHKYTSNYRRQLPQREITDAFTSLFSFLWCFW